jgi:hypothetical protein
MNEDDLRRSLHSLASDVEPAPDALVTVRRKTIQKRRLHQGVIGSAIAVVAAIVVLALVVPGASSRHVNVVNPAGRPPGPTSTVPAATSVPRTEPTVTTVPAVATAPQTLPVVACMSVYGAGSAPSAVTFGPTMAASLPVGTAALLSFYTNSTRTITPILGPRGWACQVTIGGDGSTDVQVFPAGGAAPSGSLGTAGTPGIDAMSDSACQGCVYTTVCPFVPSALGQLGYSTQTGFSCSPLPAGTTADFVKGSPTAAGPTVKDIIAFDVPTTPAPTSGLVLYDNHIGQGGSGSASQETCTLPSPQHALCTAILANFTATNWMMNS